jgi:hypothetical protein
METIDKGVLIPGAIIISGSGVFCGGIAAPIMIGNHAW